MRSRTGTSPPIRAARFADVAWLAALERESFATDRISTAEFGRLLRCDRYRIVVAQDMQGAPLGALVLKRRTVRRALYIYSLAVTSGARGRGVGKALLESGDAIAKHEGCRLIELEVRCDDQAAIGFYRDAGFRLHTELTDWYGDGGAAWRATKRVFSRGARRPAVPSDKGTQP